MPVWLPSHEFFRPPLFRSRCAAGCQRQPVFSGVDTRPGGRAAFRENAGHSWVKCFREVLVFAAVRAFRLINSHTRTPAPGAVQCNGRLITPSLMTVLRIASWAATQIPRFREAYKNRDRLAGRP